MFENVIAIRTATKTRTDEINLYSLFFVIS